MYPCQIENSNPLVTSHPKDWDSLYDMDTHDWFLHSCEEDNNIWDFNQIYRFLSFPCYLTRVDCSLAVMEFMHMAAEWCYCNVKVTSSCIMLHFMICNIIQLMHSFEVNMRICQPENSDVHGGEAKGNITFEGSLILMLTEKECTNCFVIWHCLSFPSFIYKFTQASCS